MKTSDIKLEEFNNCPGADVVKQYLYTHNLLPCIRVMDLERPHLVDFNTNDMLVLAIIKGPMAMKVALALGAMAVWFKVDELTWKVVDGTYIVRLWWD